MQCSATDTVVRGRSDAGELSLRAWREPGRERRASMRRRRRRPVPAGRRGQPVSGRYSTAICIRRHVGRVSDHIGRSLARMSICSGRRNVAACAHRKRRRMHDIFAPQDTYPPPPKKITIADIRHLSVLFCSGSTLTAVERFQLLARWPGTHSRILSGIQRTAQTVLGVYLNVLVRALLVHPAH